MNQRWRWILGSSVLVVAVIVTTLTWKPWVGKAELLTREAAEVALLAKYSGVINSNVKLGDVYLMELQTNQGLYEVEVGAYSGEVVTLQRLQGLTEDDDSSLDQDGTGESTTVPTASVRPTTPAGASTTIPSPSPTPVATTKPFPSSVPSSSTGTSREQLTSDKAGKLAAAHIKGEVEDISLKTAKDGKKFYLVEIDVDDDREAVVQVNAISGAIMSVVWEKDDDDNDNDDNDQ